MNQKQIDWDPSIPLIGVKIRLDIAGISNGFFDINIPQIFFLFKDGHKSCTI